VTHQGTNAYSRPASIDKSFEPDSGGYTGIRTPPEYGSDHLGDAQAMADDNDMVPEPAFDLDTNLSIFTRSTLHLRPLHPIRIRTGTGIRVVVRNRNRVVQMRPYKPLHRILRPKREIVKRLATSEPIVPIPYRLVHLDLDRILWIY